MSVVGKISAFALVMALLGGPAVGEQTYVISPSEVPAKIFNDRPIEGIRLRFCSTDQDGEVVNDLLNYLEAGGVSVRSTQFSTEEELIEALSQGDCTTTVSTPSRVEAINIVARAKNGEFDNLDYDAFRWLLFWNKEAETFAGVDPRESEDVLISWSFPVPGTDCLLRRTTNTCHTERGTIADFVQKAYSDAGVFRPNSFFTKAPNSDQVAFYECISEGFLGEVTRAELLQSICQGPRKI